VTEIARRPSLVDTAADILRRELQKGVWRQFLPGEHRLCERLQISRPTLRLALETLRREGLIEVSQGRRRRITALARQIPKHKGPKRIGVLTGVPYHLLSPFSLFLLGALERCIYEAGYGFELCANPTSNPSTAQRWVERLLRESTADHWVFLGFLGAVPQGESRYFSRVLVVDSRRCRPPLWGIGVDTHASAYHAVGVFKRHGHSQIALLNPRTDPPRDRLTEDGFRAGFAGARSSPGAPIVAGHNGTVPGIHEAIARLLRLRSPPSGLLVTRPQHAVTALAYLIANRVRVPEEMSIVSLGYDPVLDLVRPLMGYYGVNWEEFGRRLCRSVLHLADHGTLSRRQTLVLGEFHPRETLSLCR